MKVEAEEMPQLEMKLQESNSRLCFLVDYVTFSLTDIQLNSKTFQCHARMPSVFDQHRQIIKEKTNQFQNGLKVLEMPHAGQSAQTTLKTNDQTKHGNRNTLETDTSNLHIMQHFVHYIVHVRTTIRENNKEPPSMSVYSILSSNKTFEKIHLPAAKRQTDTKSKI